MKKLFVAALAGLLVPGLAFAADTPAKPDKCCCDKMKEGGKDCCPGKDGAGHDGHGDHKMDKPKS